MVTEKQRTAKEPCPAWRIEDFLQRVGCFTHKGHTAHLDSYLTVFEFNLLDRCLRKAKRVFTREQWKNVIGYWASNGHIGPNQILLSKIAGRIILGRK